MAAHSRHYSHQDMSLPLPLLCTTAMPPPTLLSAVSVANYWVFELRLSGSCMNERAGPARWLQASIVNNADSVASTQALWCGHAMTCCAWKLQEVGHVSALVPARRRRTRTLQMTRSVRHMAATWSIGRHELYCMTKYVRLGTGVYAYRHVDSHLESQNSRRNTWLQRSPWLMYLTSVISMEPTLFATLW